MQRNDPMHRTVREERPRNQTRWRLKCVCGRTAGRTFCCLRCALSASICWMYACTGVDFTPCSLCQFSTVPVTSRSCLPVAMLPSSADCCRDSAVARPPFKKFSAVRRPECQLKCIFKKSGALLTNTIDAVEKTCSIMSVNAFARSRIVHCKSLQQAMPAMTRDVRESELLAAAYLGLRAMPKTL